MRALLRSAPIVALAVLVLAYITKGFLPIDPTLPAAGVVTLGVAWHVIRARTVPVAWLIVLAFGLALMLSSLANLPAAETRAKLLPLVTLTLISALGAGALIRTRTHLQTLLLSMVVIGAGISVAAAIHVLTTGQIDLSTGLGNADRIAVGRGVGLALMALIVGLLYRRVHLLLGVAGVAGLAALLLLTSNRGALIGLGAATVALLLSVRDVRAARLLAAAGAAAAAVYLLLPLLPVFAQQRLTQLTQLAQGGGADLDASATARSDLWSAAWQLGSSHPLGVGVGGFAERAQVTAGVSSDLLTYPHNIWLEVWAEGGWLPALILLAVTVVAVVRVWRWQWHERGPLPALLLTTTVYLIGAHSVSSDINGGRALIALLLIGAARTWVTRPEPTPHAQTQRAAVLA